MYWSSSNPVLCTISGGGALKTDQGIVLIAIRLLVALHKEKKNFLYSIFLESVIFIVCRFCITFCSVECLLYCSSNLVLFPGPMGPGNEGNFPLDIVTLHFHVLHIL